LVLIPFCLGAFSKVYKAVHKISKTMRCVKVISKKGIDAAELKTLTEEVKILRTLDHPNILKVLEFYQDESSFYIVTEFLQGGELFDRIVASETLSEKRAAKVIHQILSAVSYIHKHNIIHRDLKPENCIFETSEEESLIKIIDFGTSIVYEAGKKLKQKLGTPYYIAPEVLKRNYDQKCDIWSCGVILYILLCGYPPFNGPSDKVILQSVMNGKFSFPEDEWSAVSESAKDLVKKMLDYNPATRPSAEKALSHEWFQQANKTERKISTKVMENMRTFKADCKLQKAILLYIITYFDIKDEKEELLKTFKSLDLDHDGQLTKQELTYGYSKIMGKTEAEKEVERIFKTIDINNTGAIDFTEFCMATANRQKVLNNERLEQVFKIFDKDGSGSISVDELQMVFVVGSRARTKRTCF
jgi:calcium-dependent protein kinase